MLTSSLCQDVVFELKSEAPGKLTSARKEPTGGDGGYEGGVWLYGGDPVVRGT